MGRGVIPMSGFQPLVFVIWFILKFSIIHHEDKQNMMMAQNF